jgi:FkbM family methyltransferase
MNLVRSLKRHVWRTATSRMHLNWTLRSGIPVIVRNYADWCTYNEVFVNQEYTQSLLDLLTEEQPHLEVLDLGANAGYFSLLLADLFLQRNRRGTLHLLLVEGSPDLSQELHERVRIADERVTVEIVSGLVGKVNGSGLFNYAREDNTNFVGTDSTSDVWRAQRGQAVIPYANLNVLAEGRGRIDLIKCDIEGSEFSFINAYPELLRRTRRLVIEFHAPFGNISEAIETLAGYGLKRRAVLRDSAASPAMLFSQSE